MPKTYGLSRGEKLKSVTRTEKLFTKGKSFWVFPFSVYYVIGSAEELKQNQFLISVGKHYFKHAVDRNRMKRLTRESYRLSKLPLYEAANNKGVTFNIGFVYKSHKLAEFDTVKDSVRKALEIVVEKVNGYSAPQAVEAAQ